MLVSVEVTEQDITDAANEPELSEHLCSVCPVARALARVVKPTLQPRVTGANFYLREIKKEEQTYLFRDLPEPASNLVVAFDAYARRKGWGMEPTPPKPLTFLINLPKKALRKEVLSAYYND